MNYQRRIDEIERAYNPDNDLIPNAPRVTYTDASLLELIKDLYERIEQLETTVSDMNQALEGVYFRNK